MVLIQKSSLQNICSFLELLRKVHPTGEYDIQRTGTNIQLLLLKYSFSRRINRGIQYPNRQNETVKMTFLFKKKKKACYIMTFIVCMYVVRPLKNTF